MLKKYFPIIGLEIHAELSTNSKMFCGCKNDPNEKKPNVNICPICVAHPGTLPVANKKAIEHVIKVGLALNGEIANFTEFDRKNYFYPDIPKGYQISQYKFPIVSGGQLNGVKITRVHLEEDTATSKHDRGNFSLVDYNRAGVPLMELVTEPVIHSAKEAGDFARELQLLLRTLGVSEANMEKGEMRVEANISLSDDESKKGTKVEVKNLNSFKSAEKAIEHELSRMEALYNAGRADEIVQETRGWDENKQITFSQRSKESAHDYRYFPDPDLPKMMLNEVFDIKKMKNELPELPWEKRKRYKEKFNINDGAVEILVSDEKLASLFEKTNSKYPQISANYIVTDIVGAIKNDLSLKVPNGGSLNKLFIMLGENKLTSKAGKEILLTLMKEGGDPEAIAKEKGMLQENNEEALIPIAKQIIGKNEKIVADYKSGKEPAIQALVGQFMKETKGSANPALALKILRELLS